VVAAIGAGLAAQLSVATVGAIPWAVLPLVAAGFVMAGLAADRATGRRSEFLRWAGTALTVIAVVVIAPAVLQPGDREAVKQGLGLMLMAAQIGQALSWRQLRDVRSGLIASFGLLVLSASYAPDVLIGAPLLLGWTAVVVALARLGGLGRVEAGRTAAAAVALGLVAFLLVPAPPTDAARSRLSTLAAQGPASRLPIDAFDAGELDLRQRGPLSATGIIRVPQDSPSLWRATTFEDYDGTRWLKHAATRTAEGFGPIYAITPPDGPTRTDVVEVLGGSATVWSPGPIVSVEAAGVPPPLVDEHGAVRLTRGIAGYAVTTRQVPDEQLRSTTGTDNADPRWTQLPATLPARVLALAAQLTAGAPTRFDAAEAIATYLRREATYRLDSPVPLPGEDAVDRFLFVDKTGFCEQFASAETIMLRAAGIPARLVTGVAYGVKDGNRKLFRVSDLHAWVELWVPGTGWVASDPTEGVPLATGGGGLDLRSRLSAAMNRLLNQVVAVPGGRRTLAVVLLGVAALAVAARRRPRTRVPSKAAGHAGPALAAFLRLDQRLGQRRRKETESLRELAARLDPALSGALGVVEREVYAREQPRAEEVTAAVAVLERASAPDPAAPRARRGRPTGPGRRARRG